MEAREENMQSFMSEGSDDAVGKDPGQRSEGVHAPFPPRQFPRLGP